jgi:hypothetical protein
MAYYRKPTASDEQKYDEFSDIFAEFDYGYTYNGCDFFCPECRNIKKCEAYAEVEESWESFYT